MNTKSTSLLLTGAMLIATILPALAERPASMTLSNKGAKSSGFKKKAHLSMKKKPATAATIKKIK